jgi:hypothetical protein
MVEDLESPESTDETEEAEEVEIVFTGEEGELEVEDDDDEELVEFRLCRLMAGFGRVMGVMGATGGIWGCPVPRPVEGTRKLWVREGIVF